MTFGTAEYIVGSMPFFFRWFVHMDNVEGNKKKGIDELELVARKGKYYGPFARMLLAVIAMREKRPWDAEGTALPGWPTNIPQNPLIQEELARAQRRLSDRRARHKEYETLWPAAHPSIVI